MNITFKDLQLKNFKAHRELSANFGENTLITGDNAKGKSSIAEAVTWVLYGTNMVGSKLDPTPDTYEADSVGAYITLLHDNNELTLGREINGARNKFILNEVPTKATDFNAHVEELFSKDLFLSLFNPLHFFTMHWEKQREMLLSFTIPPANKEVLKELPKLQAEKLATLVKKHSLGDLQKIHRDNKTKQEKAYIAAQSRTKTLQQQLDQYGGMIPLDSLHAEVAQLTKRIEEKEKATAGANETVQRTQFLQREIDSLTQQIERGKANHTALKAREIQTDCHACGQELTGEAKEKAQSTKDAELQLIADSTNPLILKRKELREQFAALPQVDTPAEAFDEIQRLTAEKQETDRQIDRWKQIEQLEKGISAAKEAEKETKESLNDSVFILDAIKAFYAKEAELQAVKIQDLFDKLTIKLFEEVKSTGDLKPTFEIQMDGKDYRKLSLSESIRAGLELRNVLSEQSGIVAPCFLDNSESITKYDKPNGQLIAAKVVADQELKIESEEV